MMTSTTTIRSPLRPHNPSSQTRPHGTSQQEVHPLKSVKNKLGELYLEWLSLPKTQQEISNYLSGQDEAEEKVIKSDHSQSAKTNKWDSLRNEEKENHPTQQHQQQQLLQRQLQHPSSPPRNYTTARAGSPPRSPLRQTVGKRLSMPKRNTPLSPPRSPPPPPPSSSTRSSGSSSIPRFYFPRNQRGSLNLSADDIKREKIRIREAFFKSSIQGFDVDQFRHVMSFVCGLPYFLCSSLFRKIDVKNSGRVTLSMFERYWFDNDMLYKDNGERIFHILRHPKRDFIVPSDFKPMMEELVYTHPSLEFLSQSDRYFQLKYMQTVIIRIYYTANRGCNGRLTYRELEQSPLVESLYMMHREDDVNMDEFFFSYEHFYVLYCKFFDLDQDRDFMISRQDLLQYGGHCLSMRIVDRVFSGYGKSLTAKQPDMMSYEDFIWFSLSEEDKSTPTARQYWFRCIDLDSTGVITIGDMKYFYQEQVERMERLGLDPIPFDDIYSQIVDLVKPRNPNQFTIKDITDAKSCSVFFSVLFNLNKLVLFDHGVYKPTDGCGEWALHARNEYERLALDQAQ